MARAFAVAVAGAAMLAVAPPILVPSAWAQGYDPMAPRNAPFNPMQPGGRERAPDAAPPNPELGGLPDAPGAEETYYLCSACHSAAIIKQQHISDARWDYLWTWMIEKQGMPEQDEETREIILDYLKRHFSSER